MKKATLRIFLLSCSLLVCCLVCFPLTVTAAAQEVRVPVVIDLSHPIAGAQFEFHHSSGLEFVSFEKSATIESAMITPTATRDGNTYFGFFGADNSFAPEGGKLNVGYLVMNHSGEPSQTLTMTEVKLVEVVDQNTTTSELRTEIAEIPVPLTDIEGLTIGDGSQPMMWFIIAGAAIVLLGGAIIIIVRQQKQIKKRLPPSAF